MNVLRRTAGVSGGILVASALLATPVSTTQEARIIGDAAIRAILVQRIDTDRRGVGIVVGVLEPGGQRIVSHGTFAVDDPRGVDAETVFEIGSVTKAFTSLLMADMVERGEINLSDPVSKYLPLTVRMPERDGKVITLQDLATHTSSLPRLPTDFKPQDPTNPYASYTVDQMYRFLSSYTLSRPIGTQFEYSNLGVGLLGHALALKAGQDYERVIRDRILTPLAMSDTTVTLSPALQDRLARGHNPRRQPTSNWDGPTLVGAGGLRSTARDLLKFLALFARGTPPSLWAAAARMRSVERPGPIPGSLAALGWLVLNRGGVETVWHSGGTGGYSAFVGYVPSRGAGVVIVSNMMPDANGVDDLGLHLLDGRVPLSRPPAPRTRITLPAEALAPLVGRYQLAPGFIAVVSQEGERLFMQPTNQPRHEIFAEGPRAFFTTIVDAQFTFEVDTTGRAVSMTLHQGGKSITGKRIE